MERGLYAAASGMLTQQRVQDTLAYNIANAGTVGFKQDRVTFQSLQTMALQRVVPGDRRSIGELGSGAEQGKVYVDWQAGPRTITREPLDASLETGCFFAVGTPRGVRYTRAGNFQMDAAGNLVTATGSSVLDTAGKPIRAATGTHPALGASGTLLLDGKPVARLQIVKARPESLARDGDGLYVAVDPRGVSPLARPTLQPGTLEQSNLNTVHGLIEMISVSRGFDLAHRALVTQDELLRHAANDLGRIG